jgi:predicted 3-demethylubiquinone-9 3-methyltransferase (glyoxalase superfamily)
VRTITPHLWFDKEAKEVAALYTSVFEDSAIKNAATLHNTPSGSVDLVTIELAGQEFRLISAGPYFKFTPAVSFLVACKTKEEVDRLWDQLSPSGSALMELGEFPFSERYGWTQDRYGLSWQVMFMGPREIKQKIIPTLMFVGAQCGKAEEAIKFYGSVFNNAEVDHILRYGGGEEPDKEGTIKHAGFTLDGEEFAAMDSARVQGFGFRQCGWLKDKFGFSWQIVPTVTDQMLRSQDEKKIARLTEAFLKMKKFDIAKLEEAFEQETAA